MNLLRELTQLLEADSQLQRLRDEKYKILDQIDDIESAEGEVPEALHRKLLQIEQQIKSKKRQLGMKVKP